MSHGGPSAGAASVPGPSRGSSLHDVTDRSFDYSHGALVRGDGTVRFRLWAPASEQVHLEIVGQDPKVMNRGADGYHELTCSCEVGARYRFRVNNDQRVPDPASRLQDDDVFGDSVVLDPGDYAWRYADWRGRPWTEVVLYEVHCGIAGGFRALEQRLPELAELGITAIELMPIGEFPGPRNWGYDGVLPYAPDGAYGSPDDLKHLIDTAHGLKLMVFLDVVYNHFGPAGNYLSLYAPDFFRADLDTPWGPAIDFRKEQVRAFFAENALYWLKEYHFDGLRLDAVHAIKERGWLTEMAHFVREHIAFDRQIHLVLENDDNAASLLKQGFDAQWNDDAHHVLHHVLTGESRGYYSDYVEHATEKLARTLAQGFVYQGELSAHKGRPRGENSAGLPPTAFVFFLQNHDQIGNRAFGERLISLCQEGTSDLHAAVALQLLTPHIPLLFMGEEYGAATPFQYFTSYADPSLAQAVREGRRAEFAAFPEFSDSSDREAIPDPNALQTWESSILQVRENDLPATQWHHWYGTLLAVRRQSITPHLTGAHSVGVRILAPLAVQARWILGNGAILTIYCNLSANDCLCPGLTSLQAESLLFSSKDGAWERLCHGWLAAACTVATSQSAAHAGARA